MSEKTQKKNETNERQVFFENPYDIETVFESLSAASDSNMELLYMDRLIYVLRSDPECDITDVSYKILKELGSI